ncbi:putative ferric reductase [Arthrobacter ulcerisalmonis]|nr:hypothetical protein [Arthrobacter ulcerisalmonis]MDQ0664487.1 putative ferric reductase [Arthrobacter ulcerisalmonis]
MVLWLVMAGAGAVVALAVIKAPLPGQRIPIWAATVEVLHMPGLVAATAGTLLFLSVGYISARNVRRKLKYETWHFLHLLTYLAIALSFSHELAGPDLAGLPLVQVAWSLL